MSEVRVKTSSFHITANTNQRYGSKDAIVADMRPLYGSMTSMFAIPENIVEMIEILKEGDTHAENIGHVETNIGIEYSPKAGLHAHILMTITHTTKVRINLPAFRKIVGETMGEKRMPHIHVRFVPDQKPVVTNSISKMVGESVMKMRSGAEWNKPMTCKCDCQIGDMSRFFS